MTVWFTSDLHFGHKRVAELRGYETVEDHDRFLSESWNADVAPGDTVWVLGDVALKGITHIEPVLNRLNGRKRLVTGNHDQCAPGVFRQSANRQALWLSVFDSVEPYHRFKSFIASHYPYVGDHKAIDRYAQWRLPDLGVPLVHGHTHAPDQGLTLTSKGTRMFHVGWDAHERPVSMEEVLSELG